MKKLKGTTTIEILVAMIISSVVFFLSYFIIFNSIGKNKFLTRYYYTSLLYNEVEQSMAMHALKPEIREYDAFTLVKNVAPSNRSSSLFILEIEIQNKEGKIIASTKRLFHDEKSSGIYPD